MLLELFVEFGRVMGHQTMFVNSLRDDVLHVSFSVNVRTHGYYVPQ